MAFSEPAKNLEAFGLHEGQHVADFGSGSGFYSLAAAKLVKESGKVYAIDVQQDLLTRLKSNAHAEHINNIEVIHGNLEAVNGTKLADNSADAVIIANVLFLSDDKQGIITEAKRILKPEGRILIVDWTDSFGGMGPTPDMVFTQQETRELCEKLGFEFVTGILAGDHHYGLSFIIHKK
jgi:ubiquinone/menaquinone biosynthesis C-methylase UbiE